MSEIEIRMEIDIAELAVRMCEANYGLTRPMADATLALEAMNDAPRRAWLRSAEAAAAYFGELLQAAATKAIMRPDDGNA